MENLLATASEADDAQGLSALVSELRASGWSSVTLASDCVVDLTNGTITSGAACFEASSQDLRMAASSAGAEALNAALDTMAKGDWDGALTLAARGLADPDTIAPALYMLALCHAGAQRAAPLGAIADFLETAGTSHPGPTALAGYAAFLEGDDTRGRKLMARAARKGRRAPEYTRTLKFVQKTLLEQHFGL
jgi:hypothetical protein